MSQTPNSVAETLFSLAQAVDYLWHPDKHVNTAIHDIAEEMRKTGYAAQISTGDDIIEMPDMPEIPELTDPKVDWSFVEAADEFKETQSRFITFGARDTEPDTEFALMMERLYQGRNPHVPRGAAGWQLFSDMTGAEAAADELTRIAEKAVAAGNYNKPEVLRWLQNNWRSSTYHSARIAKDALENSERLW